MAFQESMKGKGKTKSQKGAKGQKTRVELSQELRDRWANISPKPDRNYCVDFQEPPVGKCVLQQNGEWFGRRKLTDGSWTCMRPGCRYDHLDAPSSQRAPMMEVRAYKEAVNQYLEDTREAERLAEAEAAAAAAAAGKA